MKKIIYLGIFAGIYLFFSPGCDTPAEEFAELVAESPCVGNEDARICVEGETAGSILNDSRLHCCENKIFISKKWCSLSGDQKKTIGGEITSHLGLKKTVDIDANIKLLKYLATHKLQDHCLKCKISECEHKYFISESYNMQGKVTIDADLKAKVKLTEKLFKTLEIPLDSISITYEEGEKTNITSKGILMSLCVESYHKDCSKATADRDQYPQMTPIGSLTEKELDWVESGKNLDDFEIGMTESKSSLFGSVEVQVQADDVITTMSVITDKGTITTFRPTSLFSGSTVSGLVVTEPVGTTPDEIAINDGLLKGSVVGTEESSLPVDGGKYVVDIPTTSSDTTQITVKDPDGNIVSTWEIPLNRRHPGIRDVPAATDPGILTDVIDAPDIIQSGRAFPIDGPSDGDITNTTVVVQDIPTPVLTECSDGVIITQAPPNAVPGDASVVVIENDQVYTDDVTIVNVTLDAEPYYLKPGQQTNITVTVCGLADIEVPVQVSLENLTPSILSFTNTTVTIDPTHVDDTGCWNGQYTGIGIHKGDWNISGTIITK